MTLSPCGASPMNFNSVAEAFRTHREVPGRLRDKRLIATGCHDVELHQLMEELLNAAHQTAVECAAGFPSQSQAAA